MWNAMEKGLIAKIKTQIIIVLLLCLSALSSCRHEDSLEIIQCEVLSAFNEYPDSSFFADISSMHYQGGNLYLFDRKRGDVAVKNTTDNTFFTVGQIGQGPLELVNPTTFTVSENGYIVILDAGKLCLNFFNGKELIASSDVPSGGDTRFFIYQDTAYMTLPTDTTCYAKYTPSWKRGSIKGLDLCGNNFRITNVEEMNLLRNKRHLVKGTECLYTICPSFPIIEKYDLHSNQLLETLDLSKLDHLNKVYDFIKNEEVSPKSFYVFLQDAYYYDKRLYILFADWKKGYIVNKILVLEDRSPLKPICIYQLPDRIYTSFAVGNNEFYAFNYENTEVQIISRTIH